MAKRYQEDTAVSSSRRSHDNEDEVGLMELSEVNTEVITSKIGGLLKMLMEIDAESEATDSLSPSSPWRRQWYGQRTRLLIFYCRGVA